MLMMAHWTLLRFIFEWESYIGCSSYKAQPELQWSKDIKSDSQVTESLQSNYRVLFPVICTYLHIAC